MTVSDGNVVEEGLDVLPALVPLAGLLVLLALMALLVPDTTTVSGSDFALSDTVLLLLVNAASSRTWVPRERDGSDELHGYPPEVGALEQLASARTDRAPST
jgi:hypothetical protein